MSSCSATDCCARPGTKLNVESRRCPSRPHSAFTSSSTRGFAHFEYRMAWNSWLSAVNDFGSKCPSVSIIRSLTARARRMSSAVRCRAAEGGRGGLQDAERLHAEPVGGVVDHRHVRADVALERDETLGLELADRLTDGHDAHVELARDRAEHEPVARRELLAEDPLLDPVVRALRLARRGRRELRDASSVVTSSGAIPGTWPSTRRSWGRGRRPDGPPRPARRSRRPRPPGRGSRRRPPRRGREG